jgi:hypothetical protein
MGWSSFSRSGLLLGVLLGTAYAQSPIRMFGGLTHTGLTLSGSRLRVSISNTPAGQDWVLGVIVDPLGGPPEMAIAGAALTAVGPNRRKLDKLVSLAPSAYAISSGSVSLNLGLLPYQGALVYAVVPTGTEVVCQMNGSVVVDTQVNNSLLVRTGVLVNQPVMSLASVIHALTTPPAPLAPPYVTRPDGTVLVGSAEASRHVTSKSFPNTVSPSPKPNRHVVFQVTVAADGTVSDVRPLEGDADLAEALSGAVANWKFTPFSPNGQTVPVKMLAAFTASRSGQITCMSPR